FLLKNQRRPTRTDLCRVRLRMVRSREPSWTLVPTRRRGRSRLLLAKWCRVGFEIAQILPRPAGSILKAWPESVGRRAPSGTPARARQGPLLYCMNDYLVHNIALEFFPSGESES